MGVVHNFVNIQTILKLRDCFYQRFTKKKYISYTIYLIPLGHFNFNSASKANILQAKTQKHKGALCSCSVASPQSNILKTMKTNHPNKKLQEQHNSTSSVIECLFLEDHPKMNNLQGSYYDDSHFGIEYIQNRDT